MQMLGGGGERGWVGAGGCGCPVGLMGKWPFSRLPARAWDLGHPGVWIDGQSSRGFLNGLGLIVVNNWVWGDL